MQRTIDEFINNETLGNGLLLIDLPTGYGKTYMAAHSIFDYVNNRKGAKKIFFLTTLIKNLPADELKKVYEENGMEEQFEKDVFIIRSNYDFVYETLLNQNIPDQYRTQAYYDLKDKLVQIKKLESRGDVSLKPFIKDIEDKIRDKYEKAFRYDIKNIIKQEMPNNKAARRDLIRNCKEYQWIGKLYPTVFMDEYKVYMLTVSKFLVRNTTLIEPSYEFIRDIITDDAIIFIDEFDATKDTVQDNIIQKALDSQDDYIHLFEQIYKTMKVHTFPSSVIKPYYDYIKEKGMEITIDSLIEEATSIYDEYYLKYSYKTLSDHIDRKQSFLFNDNSYHTMLRNNRNYIRVTPNAEEGQVQIFFEDRENYYKNRSEADVVIYALIRAINRFLNRFRNMVFNWANQYSLAINKSRSETEDEFTVENAISSIYREFSLTKSQIQLMVGDICGPIKKKEKKKVIPDMSFYEIGFKYFEFIDGDEHLGKTIFNYVQIMDTPEKVILNLANKSKVIGISATASINSVVGNYDIGYLSRELGSKFVIVDESIYDSIKVELEARWKAYKEGRVKIELNVVDYNKGNQLLEERLKEILQDRDLVKKYCMELMTKTGGNKYIWQRYCNILSVLKLFLTTKGIKSFLCLNTVLPDINKTSFDLNVFWEFCRDMKEEWDIEEYELVVLKSDNFEFYKDEVLGKLSQGKKVFIFSSYKTIGAGQNMQYKVPEESNVINIFDTGIENDSRMRMKDMDALYLGDVTNLIANTYDKEHFGKKEMLQFFFNAEYLYQNDEICFDTLNRLIKQGFKSYSNSSEGDISAIKQLMESMSVRRSITRNVVQAVGRICRTYNKNERVYIVTTEELLGKLDVTCLEGKVHSPEMQAIVDYKAKMQCTYSEVERLSINKAERIASRGKNYIMKMLSRKWNALSMNLWQQLRDCVLKFPTTNMETDEFHDVIESLYIQNRNRKDSYLYAQKGDFSDVIIDYKNDKVVFQQSSRCIGKEISVVSEEESRLQQILKYPGMKEYFISKCWAAEFGKGSFILSPILFHNIYKGALGEVSGKYILEKELGLEMLEITDPDKFEFFDFEISDGIYVDFKHWKYGYPDDREKKVAEIRNKLNAINGKKVYIINIVSDDSFGVHTQNDGNIIEIPRLIDSDGNADTKMIGYLRGEMGNDLMQ